MSDQSSAELEREAEMARATMADTAETIRNKLTAGQLFDEFSGMFTGGDLAGGLNNLKSQMRDNPVPVALVATGLAWLAFGKGLTGQKHDQNGSMQVRAPHHYRDANLSGFDESDNLGGFDQSNDDASWASMADDAGGSSISDKASSIVDKAKGAAGSMSGAIGHAKEGLTQAADRLRHSMLSGKSHMPRRITNPVGKIADQEPLVIAALGVVVGAAVGAMLPASRLEKQHLGPMAERLRTDGKDMIDKGLESASNVASRAYDALKEEADHQGLTSGDGKSVSELVGEVVKSAATSVEEAAREELGRKDGSRDNGGATAYRAT